MAVQLELFQYEPQECVAFRITYLENQMEKYRKSQFAKINTLLDLYQETRKELDLIKVLLAERIELP